MDLLSTAQRPAIKLQFVRCQDRWKHRWILATENTEVLIMTSLEGTPDQELPPSAPLQEASRHCLEQGDAILCVGMAGKSHWSASFSVEGQGQDAVIKSDLACLQKTFGPDSRLGSTYTLDHSCQVQSIDKNRIEILLENQNMIAFESLVGLETIFKLNDRTLSIVPGQESLNPVVATRWGFEVAST